VDDPNNIVRLAELQDNRPPLPPPSNPMAVAREYVVQSCRHSSGALTLRYWRGGPSGHGVNSPRTAKAPAKCSAATSAPPCRQSVRFAAEPASATTSTEDWR